MQSFSIMNVPAPQLLRDYLIYMSTIKGRSPRTVEAYYCDLRLFLRYLMASRSGLPFPADDPNLESIPFASIREEMILGAKLSDAYSFLAYVQSINQNNAKTRARKVSSLRGFYKYLQNKAGRLEDNPMEQLEIPAQKKSLPKYLTLEESLRLLQSIEGKDRERDYCIITILLNCGIRLSELVGIRLSDIREDTLTVLGKGNKERLVYLNQACLDALAAYLAVRPEPPKEANKPYLFLSSHTRAPISPRRVEQIVEFHLKAAGKIYYGPDSRYDVLKEGVAGQTVRVVGYTPDKQWFKIIIDNGEAGYVNRSNIVKGKGNPVPPRSQVR